MASQGIDLIGGKIWVSSLAATAGLKKPQPQPDIRFAYQTDDHVSWLSHFPVGDDCRHFGAQVPAGGSRSLHHKRSFKPYDQSEHADF